ncbi:hypothetical protein ACJX0J_008576, partial [Zea mays]
MKYWNFPVAVFFFFFFADMFPKITRKPLKCVYVNGRVTNSIRCLLLLFKAITKTQPLDHITKNPYNIILSLLIINTID